MHLSLDWLQNTISASITPPLSQLDQRRLSAFQGIRACFRPALGGISDIRIALVEDNIDINNKNVCETRRIAANYNNRIACTLFICMTTCQPLPFASIRHTEKSKQWCRNPASSGYSVYMVQSQLNEMIFFFHF